MIVMLRSFEDQTVFYMAYAKVYKKKKMAHKYTVLQFLLSALQAQPAYAFSLSLPEFTV